METARISPAIETSLDDFIVLLVGNASSCRLNLRASGAPFHQIEALEPQSEELRREPSSGGFSLYALAAKDGFRTVKLQRPAGATVCSHSPQGTRPPAASAVLQSTAQVARQEYRRVLSRDASGA